MSINPSVYNYIEGPVTLKRKTTWVKRWAKVVNNEFTYRNTQNDKKDKVCIDLRSAKVMLG